MTLTWRDHLELVGQLVADALADPCVEDSVCVHCHASYTLRDGQEATALCDNCAQDIVARLANAIRSALRTR